MLTRLLMSAALAAGLACAPALAAPATVQLRIEGASSTIFEGPVTTDGKAITKAGHTLQCDGTTGSGNAGPGPTVTSALDDGSIAYGFNWEASFFDDFFVNSIGGEANTASQFWGYALNYQSLNVGGCQQQVRAGDEVLFAFDFFGGAPDFAAKTLLKLTGSTTASVNQPIVVNVVNGETNAPIRGASVGGKTTRSDGRAILSFDSPGAKQVKATYPGAIRSNSLRVCVAPEGGGDCGVPASQLGRGGPAHDAHAPSVRISSPRSGARYRRGPRLLRGTANDDQSGVSVVKLALRRRARGRCSWWSGRRERFVQGICRKASFFEVGNDPRWSYLMPRSLPRGSYRLDVTATDRAGNKHGRFVRGENRVAFKVLGHRRK
jgi:hypothetical protein